jgi:glucosylceramidase
MVVVVMNKTAVKQPYNVWIAGKAAESISLPHSISTIIID